MHFFLIVSISLLFAMADPFGVTTALRAASEDAFYIVQSTRYDSQDSPDVTVVLASENDFSSGASVWPIDHAIQAEVISELADQGASAVFVDFVFWDVRDEIATISLRDSISAAAKHTTVLLSAPLTSGREPSQLMQEIFYEPLGEAENVFFVSINIDAFASQTMSMPLSRPVADMSVPSAALKLREIACASMALSCLNPPRGSSIELVWPGQPVDCRNEGAPIRCSNIPKSPLSALGAMTRDSLMSGLTPRKTYPLQDLYPYKTLSASTVLNADDSAKFIDGKVVFYGGNFSGIRDVATSPVYGVVPGVFAHAVLFDNLMVYGPKSFLNKLPFGLDETTYTVFAILILSAALFVLRLAIYGTRLVAYDKPINAGAEVAFIFFLGLTLALAEALVLRTSPEHLLMTPTLISLNLIPTRMLLKYCPNFGGAGSE